MAKKQIIENKDYYLENGYVVWTEHYLEKRGYCCGNKCRHCPYEVQIKGYTTLKKDSEKDQKNNS